VWLRAGDQPSEGTFAAFRSEAINLGLRVGQRYIQFPDRLVTSVFGSAAQLSLLVNWMTEVAELRRAPEIPSDYVTAERSFQAAIADEFVAKLVPPATDKTAVTILDCGVLRGHPLLAPLLDSADVHAVSGWDKAPRVGEWHGTEVAGIAAYGPRLADQIASLQPRGDLPKLESVRLIPPPPATIDDRELDGILTAEAVALVEIAASHRRRVICLPITRSTGDCGQPTSWSANIDQLTSGAIEDDRPRRLFIVSAGNYRELLVDADYEYPRTNIDDCSTEDPAQSWNALTVGATTDRIEITEPTFEGWQPLAPRGGLCPTSRTSCAWPDVHQRKWPLKPDVVFEGGNYAMNKDGVHDRPTDLGVLTTTNRVGGALFDVMYDTSAAAAAAANLCARVWEAYPTLWPETVRAVIAHSARWTPAMVEQVPGKKSVDLLTRLRCFGYGMPDETRALSSLTNAATLIIESSIQPYRMAGSSPITNEMHVHKLPWPRDLLASLGNTPVTLRVTLSYFIEPSPGRRGWSYQHRYASHGLRFDTNRPTEDEKQLRQRISRAEWDGDDEPPFNVDETRGWALNPHWQHCRFGSLHSNWCTLPAAELALGNLVAVHPVGGWWKERKHLQRVDRETRYALIVSLETPEAGIDLYTPIANLVNVPVSVEV
jgi:hypothetical protein